MHTGTVLITGANRGLGLEFARQYASDGWQVIACCRSPNGAPDLKRLGRKVEVQVLDVASQDSIRHLAKALAGTPIDVLINNAGLHGDRRAFGETDVALWRQIFDVNTIAPVQVLAALLENVAAGAQKKVANITARSARSAMDRAAAPTPTGPQRQRSTWRW
jgi:NAD(P)-dependent dehydrogenase (short-subunit alcohol dehydrogenase family)